jgi:hypothetical protein
MLEWRYYLAYCIFQWFHHLKIIWVTTDKYKYGYELKEDEMGRTYSTLVWCNECIQNFS